MKKLITYDWNDFDALKKSFESQKKVIIPISKVLDFNFNKKMEFSSDFILSNKSLFLLFLILCIPIAAIVPIKVDINVAKIATNNV